MTWRNGPSFMCSEHIKGHFAYKGDQWFTIGKRKKDDIDTDYALADRPVELVTDPHVLAELGSAADYHKRQVAYWADYERAHA